jgi:hypothetical protein
VPLAHLALSVVAEYLQYGNIKNTRKKIYPKFNENSEKIRRKIKEKYTQKSDERVPMYHAWYYYVHTLRSTALWRSALRAVRASFSEVRPTFILRAWRERAR